MRRSYIKHKPEHKGFKPRTASLKRGTKRLGPGKKTKANRSANVILAKRFIESGLPQYCEARFEHECTGSHQLTWAHNKKRRKLPDLLHAALICQNAHNAIEFLPPEEMKAIVDEIVARREQQP